MAWPRRVVCLFDTGSRFPLMLCEGLLQRPGLEVVFNRDVASLGRRLAPGSARAALAALPYGDLILVPNREHFRDQTLLDRLEELGVWNRVAVYDFKDSPEIDHDLLGKCLAYFKRSVARGPDRLPLEPGAKPVYPLDFGVLDAYLAARAPAGTRRTIDIGWYFDPTVIARSTRRNTVYQCLLATDWGRRITRLGQVTADGATGRRGVLYDLGGNAWAEYMRLLSRTKIVFSAFQDEWDGDNRTWEALASGALCCLDASAIPMPHPPVHGRHCLRYDARDPDSVRAVTAQARRLLEPDMTARRRAMARAGCRLALARHSSRARVAYLLDVAAGIWRQADRSQPSRSSNLKISGAKKARR